GRKGHPQLEDPGAPRARLAGVPDAVAGAHPLHPARLQLTRFPGGLGVADRPLQHHRHRRDARVGVPERLHRHARLPRPEGGQGGKSARSRNTNGLMTSPRSEGLISRVMGPPPCPRVRWVMSRTDGWTFCASMLVLLSKSLKLTPPGPPPPSPPGPPARCRRG